MRLGSGYCDWDVRWLALVETCTERVYTVLDRWRSVEFVCQHHGHSEKKGVMILKGLIINAVVYLVPGVACVAVAKYVFVEGMWYDTLLLVGGVCLGGFCAMVALIKCRVREGSATKKED